MCSINRIKSNLQKLPPEASKLRLLQGKIAEIYVNVRLKRFNVNVNLHRFRHPHME